MKEKGEEAAAGKSEEVLYEIAVPANRQAKWLLIVAYMVHLNQVRHFVLRGHCARTEVDPRVVFIL